MGDILAYLDSIIVVLLYLGGFAELCGGMAYVSGAADKIMQILRYEPTIKIEGGAKLSDDAIDGTL